MATFYFEHFQCKVDVTKTDVRKVVAGWKIRFTICFKNLLFFVTQIKGYVWPKNVAPYAIFLIKISENIYELATKRLQEMNHDWISCCVSDLPMDKNYKINIEDFCK